MFTYRYIIRTDALFRYNIPAYVLFRCIIRQYVLCRNIIVMCRYTCQKYVLCQYIVQYWVCAGNMCVRLVTTVPVTCEQRPIAFYVHLVTESLRHEDVTVHYDMFNPNGSLIEGAAQSIDWADNNRKRFCVVEVQVARVMANVGADIVKRAHTTMGKALTRIFNAGAEPGTSAVLGVRPGDVPWTADNLQMEGTHKKMPQAQEQLLQNWMTFDVTKGDSMAGFVSDDSLTARHTVGNTAYAPFGVEFAALFIEHVIAKTEQGLGNVLLPPAHLRGTLTVREVQAAVKERLASTWSSFCVGEEGRCLSKFYNVQAWIEMKAEARNKYRSTKVISAARMAGFDVLLFCAIQGVTITKAFPPAPHTGGVSGVTRYFEERKAWWKKHMKEFNKVLEYLWRSCLRVDEDDMGADEHEAGSLAGSHGHQHSPR